MSEQAFEDTGDRVVQAARTAAEGMTMPQINRMQVYAKLYARWQLEKAAMDEHRQGRHTLAAGLLQRAEGIIS